MTDHPIPTQARRNRLADLFTRLLGRLDKILRAAGGFGGKLFTPIVLFVLILMLGVFARVWHYRQLPPGLNQDEASIGVEAYDLLHYGVDRNGISFPVNFVSWGDGMDALYGYVLIPFVAFGLNPFTVRLPILLAGILTLPLVFFIGKRTLGVTYGLLAMFLLAISPWHILMSRWGINENILPFVFGLGFACLLLSTPRNGWFIASAAIFGLSLYAYGGTYVAVPLFLLAAVPVLLITKRVSVRSLIAGLLVFGALLVPILLFVLVNALGWASIHLGIFTIPRLPIQARALEMAAVTHVNPLTALVNNARALVKLLLVYQSDGSVWNGVDPFGYLYSFSFPLAIVGAVILFPARKSKNIPEKLLLLAWTAAALCIGLAQQANINRLHLVFIPIILCAAAFLAWLGDRHKLALAAMLLVYLVSFLLFTNVYQGKVYRQQAESAFYAGLLPALQNAGQAADRPVCVTDNIHMPYIYVMFSEKMSPADFLQQVKYENPGVSAGYVRSLGRYTFGVANCSPDPQTVYVLSGDEQPPENGISYRVSDFTAFHVYSP